MQLKETLMQQLDLAREYSQLSNPSQVVSLEGFTAGAASDWRRKTGLVGSRTWGEKELRELTPPQATLAC